MLGLSSALHACGEPPRDAALFVSRGEQAGLTRALRCGAELHTKQTILEVNGNGVALLESVLFNMEAAGYISEHDHKIGGYLTRILSGGDVPGPTTVSHQHMLDLEREYFLKLIGERKTLERMQSLLKTGKPLRN